MVTPENATAWEILTHLNHEETSLEEFVEIVASFLDHPNDVTYQAYGFREMFMEHLTDSLSGRSLEGQTEPMAPNTQGQTIFLAAKVGYPGSKITDLLLGGHKVQVPNDDLVKAGRSYLKIQSEDNETGVSSYDVQINTVSMFGGDEEFAE
jgi:hypothetical protein